MATTEKSKGHLAFSNGIEYMVLGGEVYTAPVYACLDTRGVRIGRWECSVAHYIRHYAAVYEPLGLPPIAAQLDCSVQSWPRSKRGGGGEA